MRGLIPSDDSLKAIKSESVCHDCPDTLLALLTFSDVSGGTGYDI